MDGVDVKELNVKFLRSQIALVAQEPVLFSGSVYDNIRSGAGASHTHATRLCSLPPVCLVCLIFF